MLQQIRDGASGIVAKVIIGLLVIVMAFFGFGKFDFFGGGEPKVAVVNGDDITTRSYDVAVDRARGNAQGEVDEVALRKDVLNGLINRLLVKQESRAAGFVSGEAQVTKAVGQQFGDEHGNVDAAQLQAQLANINMTPSQFRETVHDDLAISQLINGLTQSEFATDNDVRLIGALVLQTRDITWVEFPVAAYAASVEVKDEELQPYYAAHGDEFQRPETVTVDYLALTPALYAADAVVSDEDVRVRYQERRPLQVSDIELKVTVTRDLTATLSLATQVAARLNGGEPFETVAAQVSDDAIAKASGGSLGLLDASALGELFGAENAKVLKSLADGAISPPIQVSNGVHLVRVKLPDATQYAPLEIQAPILKRELQLERATKVLADKRPSLAKDAFDMALPELAAKYGVKVQRSVAFTADRGEGVAANPQFRKAAFSDDVLNQGFSSEAIDIGSDVVVLKLASREAARALTLDEAKPLVRAALQRERALAKAKTDRDVVLADLKNGHDFAAAATAMGRAVQTRTAVVRGGNDLPPPVAAKAFQLPHPEEGKVTFAAADAGEDVLYAVVLRKVAPGSTIIAEQQGIGKLLANANGERAVKSYLDDLVASGDIERQESKDKD